MTKKLYRVYKLVKQINDIDEFEQTIPIGYTHAKNEKEAISNVKWAKGIKKKNYYETVNYTTNCLEKHEFFAKEIPKDELVSDYIIER